MYTNVSLVANATLLRRSGVLGAALATAIAGCSSDPSTDSEDTLQENLAAASVTIGCGTVNLCRSPAGTRCPGVLRPFGGAGPNDYSGSCQCVCGADQCAANIPGSTTGFLWQNKALGKETVWRNNALSLGGGDDLWMSATTGVSLAPASSMIVVMPKFFGRDRMAPVVSSIRSGT
jgi:hypothetical protein